MMEEPPNINDTLEEEDQQEIERLKIELEDARFDEEDAASKVSGIEQELIDLGIPNP